MAKQYGLILPGGKKPPMFIPSKNVFGEESDSGDEGQSLKQIGPLRPSHNIKRQAKIAQQKALKEDPTVYQYDELYDDMTTRKSNEKKQAKAEKKPKYIEKLLEAADKRKRENERRLERQVQKEREAEGEEFADKEAFVTSAYKKKLEELRLEEEKEKREDYLEAIGDVTKQKDLDGFYRHIYEQKLQPEKCNEKLHKQNPAIETDRKDKKRDIKSDNSTDSDSSNDSQENRTKRKSIQPSNSPHAKQKRTYRKRRSSGNLNDDNVNLDDDTAKDEINKVTLEDLKAGNRAQTHLQSNLDADSDFSIDSSSSEEEGEIKATKKQKKTIKPEKTMLKKQTDENTFKEPEPVSKSTPARDKSPEKNDKVEDVKPKIDIWKKRTVGVIFEEALKRYYERKASRNM